MAHVQQRHRSVFGPLTAPPLARALPPPPAHCQVTSECHEVDASLCGAGASGNGHRRDTGTKPLLQQPSAVAVHDARRLVAAGYRSVLLDDFDRADGPLGSNWVLSTEGRPDVVIIGNKASNVAGSGSRLATWTGALPSAPFGASIDVAISGSSNIQYGAIVLGLGGSTVNR
jgi:hypothetical protein